MRTGNRYLEAFKESYNAVGLATAVALSAATLNPLPLLAGLVGEAIYLLFVPDSKWYEARLSRKYDADVEARRKQLKDQTLPKLRTEMQERFRRLEEMRGQITVQSAEDARWFREVLRKLDYLLEKFLLFATKEQDFREYLRSVRNELMGGAARSGGKQFEYDLPPPQGRVKRIPINDDAEETPESGPSFTSTDPWVQRTVREIQDYYTREMNTIRKSVEKEPDDTRAVLEKRLDVLQRRLEFVGKSGRILNNLTHQLQLVEDTFGLINDELRARSPEQVLADVDEVVLQTDTMTQALEEIAPYEQMAARMSM